MVGKRFYYLLAAIIMNSLASFAVRVGVCDSPESYTLRINPHKFKQKIIFIGGDMERSQDFLQQAVNPKQVAKWCFGDVHFDICRVSYDKKQELIEGKKTFNFYDNAIKSMKLLKKVNPDIRFWATMKSDYNGYGHENNLPDWICDYKPTTGFDCDKYAGFLADYLELMQNNGVRIHYLAVAKEWIHVVTAERAKQTILRLNSICKQRKIHKPLYVDPASWGVTQGAAFVRQVDKIGSQGLYYGFSTHNLNKKEHSKFLYEDFVSAVSHCGKYAFADETATGSGGRTHGEEPDNIDHILNAYREKTEFYHDGIQGELFFEPFSRGVSSETRSIYFKKNGQAKRMRSYYVMRHFVNSIAGKGMYYVPFYTEDAKKEVYAMAFTNGEELFVTIVNQYDGLQSNVSISLPNDYQVGTVKRCIFEKTFSILGEEDQIEGVNSSVTFNLPAKSITFLSFKL